MAFEDSDTVLEDAGYLDTIDEAPAEPTLEEELAATPLPEPRDLGGVVIGAETVRLELVMLRRLRRREGRPWR